MTLSARTETSYPATPRPRPTLLIAEALVNREGPGEIAERARRHGFSPSLTKAAVAVCCQTAIDTAAVHRPHRPSPEYPLT